MSQHPTAPCFASNRGSKRPLHLMKRLAGAAALFSALAVQLAMPQARNSNATPLLVDGTVNLGPVAGEKGVWELSYVENIANYVVPVPVSNGNDRSEARGSAAEPQIPFL